MDELKAGRELDAMVAERVMGWIDVKLQPIANALGQFADTLRMRRTQAAEEAAAKTGVKLLFPLVLFIFPSIFVVALGPAIISIHRMFTNFGK